MKNQNSSRISGKAPCLALCVLMGIVDLSCGGPAVTSTVSAAGAGTGVGGLGQGPTPVTLGTAANYVILAESAITNVPTSPVTGNVGLSPGTGAGNHLTCAEVTGTINSVDAAGPAPCYVTAASQLSTAILDKGTAYTNAAGRAADVTELGAGNIGGLNLGPATYKWSSSVLIPTNVTLTGGANDVWIFQIAQGLTVSSGVQVILAGGALAQNIYWQVYAAADLGTTSVFKGTIISATSIVLKTGASIKGRILAGTAVSLDSTTVTAP
ncbi:MAG: ice-binding family protein [Bdellovibrionia bacterium]